MNKLLKFITVFLLFFSMIACDALESEEDPNELGGETNIPLNQVGNTFYGSLQVNGAYVSVDQTMEITSSSNGVINLKVSANIAQAPELAGIYDLIPAEFKGENGTIDANLKFKITSEGIQDFINPDKKAHTIVKYSDGVGAKYSISLSDGKTVTRTVTAKSDQDDFEYGFYLIKTMTIEQNSINPGIKKYIIRTNHKFGLVYAEAILEDGSSVSLLLFPDKY